MCVCVGGGGGGTSYMGYIDMCHIDMCHETRYSIIFAPFGIVPRCDP